MDEQLHELAAQQHGYITRATARAHLSADALRHRIRRGDWEPEGPRVLHRVGAPRTAAAKVTRAVLDAGPGAVLSHAPAAHWWGLPGFDLRTLHVTRPRGITSGRATFAVLHTVIELRAQDVTVLDGIPIVRPERLMLDLAATVHIGRAERALDNAWARGLLSGRSLQSFVDDLGASGRDGIGSLRSLLEPRGRGYVPPATNLESRVRHIFAEAGLGEWRRQVDLGGEAWAGRVDFLSARWPIVVEVQSERYHASLCDRAADATRRARLEAAGFVFVEVWDTQVWHDRDAVIAAVLAAVSRFSRLNSASRRGIQTRKAWVMT